MWIVGWRRRTSSRPCRTPTCGSKQKPTGTEYDRCPFACLPCVFSVWLRFATFTLVLFSLHSWLLCHPVLINAMLQLVHFVDAVLGLDCALLSSSPYCCVLHAGFCAQLPCCTSLLSSSAFHLVAFFRVLSNLLSCSARPAGHPAVFFCPPC